MHGILFAIVSACFGLRLQPLAGLALSPIVVERSVLPIVFAAEVLPESGLCSLWTSGLVLGGLCLWRYCFLHAVLFKFCEFLFELGDHVFFGGRSGRNSFEEQPLGAIWIRDLTIVVLGVEVLVDYLLAWVELESLLGGLRF